MNLKFKRFLVKNNKNSTKKTEMHKCYMSYIYKLDRTYIQI